MLYTVYTDEEQLGCDNENKGQQLYMRKKYDMQYVKGHMMPFAQGVEKARHHVEEAMKEEGSKTSNIGNLLDPELEQEIIECQESEELMHPDFVQVNPDDFEIEKNVQQVHRTFRTIERKTFDDIVQEARKVDEFQCT